MNVNAKSPNELVEKKSSDKPPAKAKKSVVRQSADKLVKITTTKTKLGITP